MNASPFKKPLDYGVAEIQAPWPNSCGPRQLRGAVIATLGQHLSSEELAPWSGRNSSGNNLQGPPIVSYRVHQGQASLFVVGPSTKLHLAQAAQYLDELFLPDGTPVAVRGVSTRSYDGEVRQLRAGWVRYRLRTPYFPSASAEQRRPPKDRRWADRAWAAMAITSSLQLWAAAWGLEPPPHRPFSVEVERMRLRKVAWARPAKDLRVERIGFDGVFVANVLVPPGACIGAKGSEGMGELELLGAWEGRRGAH